MIRTRLSRCKDVKDKAVSGCISGAVIVDVRNSGDLASGAVLSLLFAEGQRPDANMVAAAGTDPGAGHYAISHRPGDADGWVELLGKGLTFDCRGLAPTRPLDVTIAGALLGLDKLPGGEAVTLGPGPHIVAGRGLLPVVRVLAAIGRRLADLPHIRAVGWLPAGSWMEPGYFRRVVGDWLDGGAFPALGLTSLRRESNGAMVSLGLGLLIGQELRFEPERTLSAAAVARISVRLINELIANGPLDEPREFVGSDGEVLLAVPVRDGSQLRVMVRK